MTKIDVMVRKAVHGVDLELPKPATPGASGMDLLAALSTPQTLMPGEFKTIPTGLEIAIPCGHEAQIRPRSGLAARHGVTVLNSPGTIDQDYRGEVKVILINHGPKPFVVDHGMRIAQLVFASIVSVKWQESSALSITDRGSSGFGSTGL